MAYKIAAHAADVALGIPGSRDRDDELTKARAALNWKKHFELSFDPDVARAYHDEDLDVDTEFCAMCGHDWCSVRISKEIVEFASGKEAEYQWDRATVSAALSAEQQAILEQRGVLSPAEIHRLASKVRGAVAPVDDKAECHSDYVDAQEAQRIQKSRLEIVDVFSPPISIRNLPTSLTRLASHLTPHFTSIGCIRGIHIESDFLNLLPLPYLLPPGNPAIYQARINQRNHNFTAVRPAGGSNATRTLSIVGNQSLLLLTTYFPFSEQPREAIKGPNTVS